MIAPLLGILMVGCGFACWAWRYQQRARRVLGSRPSASRSDRPRPVARRSTEPEKVAADPAPAPTEPAPARVAVRQLERAAPEYPSSVLGWEAFVLVSTLVLEGTVLLACRRQRHGGVHSQPEAPEAPDEDATVVLLIGDDERAGQAVGLLEGWRRTEATLRLRPTTVAGAIEVFDGAKSAIRAALLAA